MKSFQRSVASRPRADLSKQYLRLSNRLVVTDSGAFLVGSSLTSSSGLSLSSSKGFASQWVWKSATWRLLLLLVPAIFIVQSLLSNRYSQYLDAEGAEEKNAISAVDAIGAAGTAPIAAIVEAQGSFASRASRAGADGGGERALMGLLTGSGTGGDNDANPEQQKRQDHEWQQQQPRQQRRRQQQRQLREEPFGQQPHQHQQQQQPISMIALTASSSADLASTVEPSATTAATTAAAATRTETAVPAAWLHKDSNGNVADRANAKSNVYHGEPSTDPHSTAHGGGADWGNASGANGHGARSASSAISASGARGRIKGSQRFYTVTGEGDYCAGESHWTWSFLCAAAEAKLLNRMLIIPMARCLDARHTLSHLTEEKPLVLYYDMDHWARIQPIMLDLQFEINIGPLNVTILRERHNMSVREFQATEPTSRLESEDARSATLIVRKARFAFEMCSEDRDEGIHLEADSTTHEFKLFHGKGGLYIGKAVFKNNVFVLDFVPDQGTADSDAIVNFASWTHPPDLDPDFSPGGFWYSHTIPEAERTLALATIRQEETPSKAAATLTAPIAGSSTAPVRIDDTPPTPAQQLTPTPRKVHRSANFTTGFYSNSELYRRSPGHRASKSLWHERLGHPSNTTINNTIKAAVLDKDSLLLPDGRELQRVRGTCFTHQWPEAIDHAVMLHNLLSSSSLPNNASPHLLWTGKLGNTKMLRVFGCMETVAARDVIFYERLTLQTYLDNLAANRDLTGGFRGNRAFASAADEADWDEHNVDGASEEARPLPYRSVPIPMDDENPRESVNAETYFDFADTGYVTPQPVDTHVSKRIGPNFLPDPEAEDEAAYLEDANLTRYTQSGLQILGLVTAVHGAAPPKEIANIQQALGGEHREKWREAMDKELKALQERNT
ncbi:unnamed protein product [Closterium sp. NIES-54]